MHHCERRAAARWRSDAVARKNLHVLSDHLGVIQVRLDPRNAGDQAVDVILGDARVIHRELRRLRHIAASHSDPLRHRLWYRRRQRSQLYS